jgi:hypothetical protein
MKYSLFTIIIILAILVLYTGCSDLYSYEPIRIEMLSLEDGDTLKKNDDVYFKIVVDEGETGPQKLIIDLIDSDGMIMASNTLNSPEINTEIILNDLINESLDLSYGEYSLAFTISSEKEIIFKEEWVFFYVGESYSINGIWSYPWLLEPKDKALLIADVKTSPSLNPYIRWSQDGVVIAKGLLSKGFDQILWETPPKEGVYSIRVEYFPFAPSGFLDYDFYSKTAMTAELYVSSSLKNTTANNKKQNIVYTLFDMYLQSKEQLYSSNSSFAQTQISKPKIVLNNDIIGFQLDGKSGFVCDKVIVPIKDKRIQSFNISLGITPQASLNQKTIFYIYTDNGSFSLRCFFNDKQNLIATMTVDDVIHTFASGIDSLMMGERYVLDFSLVFEADVLKAVWKLNGKQVTAIQNSFTAQQINSSGFSILGGNNSFIGIIDMLDVAVLNGSDIGLLDPANRQMLARRLK